MRFLPSLRLATAWGVIALSTSFLPAAGAQSGDGRAAAGAQVEVCGPCLRANMQFLASDALRGRGSTTPDELLAATYVATELERAEVEPTGDMASGRHSFVQEIRVRVPKVLSPPRLRMGSGSSAFTLTCGQEFHAFRLPGAEISGVLSRSGDRSTSELQGKTLFYLPTFADNVTPAEIEKTRASYSTTPTAGVLLAPVPKELRRRLTERTESFPTLAPEIEGVRNEPRTAVIYLEPESLRRLREMPDGTAMRLEAETRNDDLRTWNVVGVLPGSDAEQAGEVLLFSAHLDHIGMGPAVNGDSIYNGADDDASGVTAVLEIARVMGQGPRPKRTLVFALFGGEEKGLWGARYYRAHPTVATSKIVANLEFEMIARPDPAVAAQTLWLTGWERSNLGPELARQGARLVADPHPEELFFQRSDNYELARDGVVAHTVSSFGLHPDYHRPSDDLAKVDWKHMEESLEALMGALRRLANTSFRPQWVEGGQPH
jgi:hypothetical protein